jgi:WD40 repeat protein
MLCWRWIAASVAACGIAAGAWGQSDTCSVAVPDVTSTAPNIFNDRQEQDLADALAEYFESNMRIAAPAADDQLTQVGERLLKTLPPTGIHYQFRIYDSGEINGFSIGGGRVYISRKLIAALKSEDDLAGVVAHEIGHISTHQTAIAMTRLFQKRLGVTQVGDRADIYARVHQLLSTPAKPGDDKHDEKGELTADRVAVYAMVRAGYAPESFATFFDRASENNGKTGNWFTNAFGTTKEDSQRYAQALKLIGTLPPGCKGLRAPNRDAFQAWERGVVEERITDVAEGLSGEKTTKLDPPLRPTFSKLRFSPDGKMLLGQDEGSIVVVDRESGKLLFRIDAPDANFAQFTPDSKGVVFHDDKLRVERWDTATGKRASVKEVVLFSGCGQTVLSPDGRTLGCITLKDEDAAIRIGIQIIDVDSGKLVYEKTNFYQPSAFDYDGRLIRLAMNIVEGYNIVNVATSQDGRYMVLAAGSKSLAFDLEKQQPIQLEGKLKGLSQVRMTFVGPNQLAVLGERNKDNLNTLHILSFPDGKEIKEAEIGDQQFTSATKPNTLVVWRLKDYAAVVYDLDSKKITAGSKLDAMDEWGPYTLAEDAAGGVDLFQDGEAKPRRIPVDVGPLPALNKGTFSPDGKFLTISLKNRAALWDLDSGKQVALIRPFKSAWMDDKDNVFGQFPKYVNMDPKELKISVGPLHSTELAKLDDDEWQYHDLELRFKPIGKSKGVVRHATLEVRKMDGQSVAWSREFNAETPACWPAEDDRLVLAWDLSNDAAKSEVRAHPELQKELDALKQRKGLLLETVTPETGTPLQEVVVPEADLTRGWNDVRRAQVSGDVVLARGEHENTTIYRLKDGGKIGEFFGRPLATSAELHLVAAVNRENEILLVDEATGKELKRFTLSSPVRLARIVGATDKMLMVLTADQVVHRIAVP